MRRLLFAVFVFWGWGLSALPVRPVSELSTEWIMKTIHEKNITTIEGLLGQFQPKSLERHVLAYSSESLQFASWLSPRAVVYSFDADFIMAFNGLAGSDGYHEIEIIKFDHKRRAFQPEVIHFDPAGLQAPKLNAHPTECVDCHQQDMRPNWEPYFHWVGFYGSEDDNQNAGGEAPHILNHGVEHSYYQKFLKKQNFQIAKKAGRYRFLPKHPHYRPNDDLNDRMACLNMKRLLRAFTEDPLSGRLASAIHKGSVHLDKIPADLKARARHTYAEVRASTERAMQDAMTRRVERHVKATGSEPLGRVERLNRATGKYDDVSYSLDLIAGWRYLFEEILGKSFRPYSTSRHTDFHLNLGASLDLHYLWENATVDPVTGRAVLSREPQKRSESSYGFTCPRSDHYDEMPIGTDDDFRLDFPEDFELDFKMFDLNRIKSGL